MDNNSLQYKKMTSTSIPRLILGLSVPTILSMLVTNVYNLADTAFVGQLGNSASAGVGIVFGLMAILQAIGYMFGQGSGAIASRYLGAQKIQDAGDVASVGFFSSFIIGIIIGIIGLIFRRPLVMMLGSTETIAPYAEKYVFYILLSAPFIMSSFVLNNILRYEGKATLGMVGMMSGGILNIIGDPILMFKFKMGISGAGLSTALSQVINFGILLFMFLSGKTTCKLSCKNIFGKLRNIGNICSTGLPSLLRQALNSITTVMMNNYAGLYGDTAVAAMSIVARITFFVFSVSLGIGQGYQPVSSFNYGAKKYSRIRHGYKFTLLASLSALAVINTIIMIFSQSLIGIFRDDPTVIQIGTEALRLQCLSLYILPFVSITEMQLQTTGQKLYASLLSSMRSGLFFIPLLPIMNHLHGLHGVEEAQPIALMLTLIPSFMFIRSFFLHLPEQDGDTCK